MPCKLCLLLQVIAFLPPAAPSRDLCSTLQDCSLISSSPFLSFLPLRRHCWMACLGSFSAPQHMESAHEKLQKNLKLHTASSDFYCVSELLRWLCRKDPLITFYWAVKLWPPMPLAGLAKVREGPFPSCPGLGNGLVDLTSFGSLCPIRSPLTPVPKTRYSSTRPESTMLVASDHLATGPSDLLLTQPFIFSRCSGHVTHSDKQ